MELSSKVKKALLSTAAGAGAVTALVLIARRAPGARRSYAPWKQGGVARDRVVWRFDNRVSVLPPGKALRIEVASPAAIRWTTDQWNTAHETRTTRKGGVHVADLHTWDLPAGSRVQFTFFWPEANRWEGQDFDVTVAGQARYGGAAGD